MAWLTAAGTSSAMTTLQRGSSGDRQSWQRLSNGDASRLGVDSMGLRGMPHDQAAALDRRISSHGPFQPEVRTPPHPATCTTTTAVPQLSPTALEELCCRPSPYRSPPLDVREEWSPTHSGAALCHAPMEAVACWGPHMRRW